MPPYRKEESLKYIRSQLFELSGGSGRDRTDYLILARDAFSQVNYKPIKMAGVGGFKPPDAAVNLTLVKLMFALLY